MSILIKGMKMPENGCDHCFLRLGNYCRQIPTDASMVQYAEKSTRHPDCPLVPVPPHGRLIDADELLTHRFVGVVGEAEKSSYMVGWNTAMEAVVENAPTIIPAEVDA